jgi:bifunctional non-homologous end joining protein LigD
MSEMKFGKYFVKTSNEEKIFFPKTKITKGDLINYYCDIADVMLPHIKDRPISMLRQPDGIKGETFFQKDASEYYPQWIKTKRIKKKEGGNVDHVICNNKATLVYLANQACITPHVWLSKINKLEYPDRLIFDIDPPEEKIDFKIVISAVKILYDFLTGELNIAPFLMTTGSRGLHIVIPINKKEKFDFVRKLAQDIAGILAERHSKELTIEVRKNKRKGRIFLDTARNAYAQTAVPPYSVRPIEGAPVSAPITWDELSGKSINAQSFNIKNIFKRLDEIEDPWKNINRKKYSLTKSRKILDNILKQSG